MATPLYREALSPLRGDHEVVLPSRRVANLLVFTDLERFHDLRWVFTIAWRFEDLSGEVWTHRINEFERGTPQSISGAIRVVSLALRGIDWRQRKIALTAAIPSGRRRDSPLALLGRGVATRTGLPWHPEILKARRSPMPRLLGGREGSRYRCRAVNEVSTLIVLDAVVDRGESLSEIGRAIHESNETMEVFGFALGKAESWGLAKLRGHSLGNQHVPAAWGRVWDTA